MVNYCIRLPRVWAMSIPIALILMWSAAAGAARLPDFTRVVKEFGPAVVNISTTQKVKPQGHGMPHGDSPFPEGTPFDEFFRRFFDENGEPREYNARSLGSGFIVSPDGYILTNHHVISEADEIVVRLNDRRELEAEVIGSDERSDIALLKVSADDLPVVTIGVSHNLEVGEWVLAIGSPFDFDHSVTAGIVSALGRSLPNENYVPFIQTDVAINPGNSGGPLFNLDGEVVGVNAQIYSRTGGFMGLSFAIPIDLAMDVVDQLKSTGRVSRGWLGVLIQDVTRELAESFGMDKPGGALVSQVLPDSPAAEAGIEVGDVIVEFRGREVANSSALPPMVGATPINDEVDIKVLRNGRHKVLELTIGELPPADEIRRASTEPGSSVDRRLKVEVTELDDEQRERLGIERHGVLVTAVEDGPANDAGIREGDVITMINNKDVEGVKHFRKLVDDLPEGKPVAVLVQRSNGPAFLAIRIPNDD